VNNVSSEVFLGEIWEDLPFSLPMNLAGDRRLDRAFRAARAPKTMGCVVPGCAKKFRSSTNYADFLTHYRAKHGKQS
jgi:hypothetical protein